ncbi:MAG: hypothetical protein KDE54_02820 [Caldilineaceae bacterium]|nr:hypothetical protein [Caldilineaceae bacterium]
MNRSNPDDYRHLIWMAADPSQKQQLARMYNVLFFDEDIYIPEEMDETWLGYMDGNDFLEEFDRQLENAQQIPLREYLGNPSFTPLMDLPPEEVEPELERILDLMADNNVYIDFLSDIESDEAYRFITEELFEEVIDDIRIEGMNQHFIYEEFYPSEEFRDDDFYEDEYSSDEDYF